MADVTYNFNGKIALITGGGTGIGFTISSAFATAGAKVIITGRREDVLKEACASLGHGADYIVNDVRDLDSLPAMVDRIETNHGPIDILVNNSGINLKKHALETTDREFSDIIQTNLSGLYTLTREVAGKMTKRHRGSIILITSMAAIYGIPEVSAYTASKSAVLGLTRSLAVDLSPFGVRVNAVAPGFIDTPMLRRAFSADPERERRVLERTPMRKLGTTEDIANAVLFLASDQAAFITGVNLPVDGGNSIGF
jgi:NAD(P)-dependent dehydrogenase (short-subunit alcohol dehydrogenase family)